jgi:hypothetical protein
MRLLKRWFGGGIRKGCQSRELIESNAIIVAEYTKLGNPSRPHRGITQYRYKLYQKINYFDNIKIEVENGEWDIFVLSEDEAVEHHFWQGLRPDHLLAINSTADTNAIIETVKDVIANDAGAGPFESGGVWGCRGATIGLWDKAEYEKGKPYPIDMDRYWAADKKAIRSMTGADGLYNCWVLRDNESIIAVWLDFESDVR